MSATVPRLTAADWCFFPKGGDSAAYYRAIAAAGVRGVEMVPPERRADAKAAGLELVTLSAPGMQAGLNRLDEHAEFLPRLRTAIAETAAAGAANCIVFSGNRRGLGDDAGVHACVRGLSAVVADAERAGITLLFEVLNAFDHADYHADRGDFAFRVVRAVGSPRLRVLYDLYHMQRMGEALLPSVLANLPLIGHFHIAGSPRRDFPGADQPIDYPTIIHRVQDAGYVGWWGLEFRPTGEPVDEVARAVRHLVA